MKTFTHYNARSIGEALDLLKKHGGKAKLNAGGTDLLGMLKGNSLSAYPEAVINLKTIDGLDYVRQDEEGLRMGALTKLARIAASGTVKKDYGVLARAALSVATPQVRNMCTLGGNLAQDVRCWYYRYPQHLGGPITCLRKGSGSCLAVRGDNRYHAVMQAKKCFAVCPSDTATALAALDGQVEAAGPKGERSIAIGDFFNPLGNALATGEIVTGVFVPALGRPARQTFLKFTLRRPVDFAVVSVASVMALTDGVCTDVRIAIGAVGPGPVRAREAEEFVKGKAVDEQVAVEAAKMALGGARPLSRNGYKVEIAKLLVKRAILGRE